MGAKTRGSGVVCAKVAGVDPATAGVGGMPVTICRACALPEVSGAFCLFVVLPGSSIGTHVLNSKFPQTVPIDACDSARVQLNLGL
ncbi:UNVERIFIED_CONTAM: hypothetical protein Slati_2162200 [Sesamum latifolium]|uniref:Uncharacterized protein n=1 Tax=Sesamum latifolium TaxID=2727402 RepID=A0AAW2WSI4_9LAMI